MEITLNEISLTFTEFHVLRSSKDHRHKWKCGSAKHSTWNRKWSKETRHFKVQWWEHCTVPLVFTGMTNCLLEQRNISQSSYFAAYHKSTLGTSGIYKSLFWPWYIISVLILLPSFATICSFSGSCSLFHQRTLCQYLHIAQNPRDTIHSHLLTSQHGALLFPSEGLKMLWGCLEKYF